MNGTNSTKTNLLSLIYSCTEFNIKYPGAYCVYSPLAIATLFDLQKRLYRNFAAQVILFLDYLQGLAYLHQNKGVMHRDIKPENLGVVSLRPLKGVIMDMDDATQIDFSNDHGKGTICYLAPEIIDLKLLSGRIPSPQPYGKAVDVWALGLTAFVIVEGGLVKWNEFDRVVTDAPTLHDTRNFVTARRYDDFLRHRLQRIPLHPDNPRFRPYLDTIRNMLAWKSDQRITASDALIAIQQLLPKRTEGSPGPECGRKRRIHET